MLPAQMNPMSSPDGMTLRPSRSRKHPLRHKAEQALLRLVLPLLLRSVRRRSLASLRRTAGRIAALIWRSGVRRRMMLNNLRRAFPTATEEELNHIARLSIVNICKTMAELVKMRWMTDDELKALFTIEGVENLEAAFARGKGVLLITAHFGNWELCGGLLSVLGYPMNVIARDASQDYTRDLVNDARRSKGVKVFGRWDAREILRAIKNGECVAILPDQHAAEAAVRVTFLGRPADTATGPIMFARRTGAAIIPGFIYRQPDDHFLLRLLPEVVPVETDDRDADLITNVQCLNDIIGAQILQHPEQWLWLHNRWKADPDNAV
jgi:KDO2-lipid IV(A) lauroyltransferase